MPGIPSAEELVKQGVDAVQLNARLLEKIEELMLYLIEVTKQSQQQKTHNQEQQKRIEKLEKQFQTLTVRN